MDDSLDDWFKREILPHEAALLRYLIRFWKSRHEVEDLCQESFVRVYEAAGFVASGGDAKKIIMTKRVSE